MDNRIVEIASDSIHLSLTRGFLKLSHNGDAFGQVALPDIGALIVRGYGCTISLNLCARLADDGIPVILCGTDQSPASVIWPLKGHHTQSDTIVAQAEASKPQKKRLWQAIVQAKITAQAQALEAYGEIATDLFEIAGRVRSGDPDNQEAFAARRYWSRMMGKVETHFTRDKTRDGLNAALNYGYAVLRAGSSRSLLAAGLHPAFSLHHKSRGEALRLASDVMEPFRPWVDLTVRRLAEKGDDLALCRDTKAAIVEVLALDLAGPYGASPLQTCLDRMCASLAAVHRGERRMLELPGGLASNAATEKARIR